MRAIYDAVRPASTERKTPEVSRIPGDTLPGFRVDIRTDVAKKHTDCRDVTLALAEAKATPLDVQKSGRSLSDVLRVRLILSLQFPLAFKRRYRQKFWG